MIARLGDRVTENSNLAAVYDALGRSRSLVRSKTSGVVIGHVTSPIVNRGDAVAHVAEVSTESS